MESSNLSASRIVRVCRMTKRLYYNDASLLEFEAKIVDCGRHNNEYFTVLEKSAFYPTSGGQLHDAGTLNGVQVTDVIESDAHEVWHITGKPVGNVGDIVRGRVDKDRRQVHRQMHTAQHILSQAFVRLYGFETVSVHLGEEYAAVELDTPQVSSEQITRAEQMANQVVNANSPIEILFVESDQAASLPLRKIPSREGTIRVIKIGDFDWSACGGTHCNSTAEVVMCKLTGVEKMRGRSLVKFLAGKQAFDDYCNRFSITSELSRRFTCNVNDLNGRVEKLVAENESKRKEIARLQKELLPVWADKLAAEAKACGKYKLVCQAMDLSDDRSAAQLARLAAGRIEGIAVLLVSDRLLVAVAPESGLHAGQLAMRFSELTGLRGGGSAAFAQLGGAEEEKMPHYQEVIEKLLSDG